MDIFIWMWIPTKYLACGVLWYCYLLFWNARLVILWWSWPGLWAGLRKGIASTLCKPAVMWATCCFFCYHCDPSEINATVQLQKWESQRSVLGHRAERSVTFISACYHHHQTHPNGTPTFVSVLRFICIVLEVVPHIWALPNPPLVQIKQSQSPTLNMSHLFDLG